MKRCRKCKTLKPLKAFKYLPFKGSVKKYRHHICRTCTSKHGNRHRAEFRAIGLCFCGAKPKPGRAMCVYHTKEKRQQYKKHRLSILDAISLRNRKKSRDARLKVIEAYGSKCKCCGETLKEFLTVDHIKGGGRQHGKQLRAENTTITEWLIKNGFPQDDFRLLCMSCNYSYGRYGYCPHNTEGEMLAIRRAENS